MYVRKSFFSKRAVMPCYRLPREMAESVPKKRRGVALREAVSGHGGDGLHTAHSHGPSPTSTFPPNSCRHGAARPPASMQTRGGGAPPAGRCGERKHGSDPTPPSAEGRAGRTSCRQHNKMVPFRLFSASGWLRRRRPAKGQRIFGASLKGRHLSPRPLNGSAHLQCAALGGTRASPPSRSCIIHEEAGPLAHYQGRAEGGTVTRL